MNRIIIDREGNWYSTGTMHFNENAQILKHKNKHTRTYFKCKLRPLNDGAYIVTIEHKDYTEHKYLLKEQIHSIKNIQV